MPSPSTSGTLLPMAYSPHVLLALSQKRVPSLERTITSQRPSQLMSHATTMSFCPPQMFTLGPMSMVHSSSPVKR